MYRKIVFLCFNGALEFCTSPSPYVQSHCFIGEPLFVDASVNVIGVLEQPLVSAEKFAAGPLIIILPLKLIVS